MTNEIEVVQEQERRPRSDLRMKVDSYFQCQRNRIAAENRARAYAQGADEGANDAVASDQIVECMRLAEQVAMRRVEAALQDHPCMNWAMGVPGMNRATIGRLVGLIDDPTQFARFSNLRSHAGLCHLTNKLKKGEKAKFSMRLKTSIFVAWECMLKQHNAKCANPPEKRYTDIYYNWREIYKVRFGAGDVKKKANGKDEHGNAYTATDEIAKEWPDRRQQYAAKNKMMDVFLYHLYEEWLTNLGLPVPGLYVHEVLGHHMKYDRKEFSNSEFAAKKLKKLSSHKSLDRDIEEMKLETVGPTGKVPVVV